MRDVIIRLAFLAALIWSAWVLGGGFMTIHTLNADASGETAWQITKSVMGDGSDAARSLFVQQWANPIYRQSWLSNFESAFWTARLRLWVFPLLGIGVLAFLALALPNGEKERAP